MQAGDFELITKSANIAFVNQTAELIVKFGFLDTGLALIFLVAPFVYFVWKSKNLTLSVACFGIAFVIAFGVLGILDRFSRQRVLLTGAVIEVPNGFQVQIASNSRRAGTAYLKRENHAENREWNNFFFVLVASRPPNCLSVAINNNNPQSESGSSAFKISPISPEDFKANSELVVKAVRSGAGFNIRYWREAEEKQIGTPVVLPPLADDVAGCEVGQDNAGIGNFIARAFAQSNPALNFNDLSASLKSDDLNTRRNARIDLSKQGMASIETARKLLNSGEYRLQLGALVALSIMSEQERRQLPPDIAAKVREFQNNSDPTIRDTARRILP